MNILYVIGLSFVSAILYRLGGKHGYNTKYRDWGVPLIGLITLILLKFPVPWYIHVLPGIFYFGALTTYWDTLLGEDNFFVHGAMCGLAYFPYAIYSHDWATLFLRVALLTIFVGAWSKKIGEDWLEEGGRGFFLNLSLLMYGW